MPITSTGQISIIADIAAEFTSLGSSDVTLAAARDAAGLPSGEVQMTDFYGLSDAAAPGVTTGGVNSINHSQMRVYGSVGSDGGATVTSRGFYFGTSSNYLYNAKYTVGSGTGSFNRTFTGLSASSTYRYTAFAINSAGETVGSTQTQATSAAPISVSIVHHTGYNSKISTSGGQGPFNGYVWYGGCSGGFQNLSRSMPSGSIYVHTFGKACASGVSWNENDYSYAGSVSSGGQYGFSFTADGNGSNSYIAPAGTYRYEQTYTVGNYSLSRGGSASQTVSIT